MSEIIEAYGDALVYFGGASFGFGIMGSLLVRYTSLINQILNGIFC